MLRIITILALAHLLVALPAHAQLRISDGDTLTLNRERIRLACIDAPESDQPYGPQSAARLRDLLGTGSIRVQPLATDRYGRSIAKLYIGETLVQEALVREGLAWVYPQFLHRCPTTATRLQNAQQTAQQHRLGLWADPHPIPPWVWRSGPPRRR
ncbi:MAG: thermonuclease family protein [Thermostichus sp. DRC_bins_24]